MTTSNDSRTANEARSTIKVLFAKSNADECFSLENFLSNTEGLVLVAEAADQSEAMQILQDKQVDVVLIDFAVADLSGLELTKKIKETHPGVRVLMVTANNTPEDIFASLDAGADGYVLKENMANALEIVLHSVRLGAVWLDPGIAKQVLIAAQTPIVKTSRVLPTGMMPLPLLAMEDSLLNEVAASNCSGGVCLVDPSFIQKLKRFAPTT